MDEKHPKYTFDADEAKTTGLAGSLDCTGSPE